MIAIFCTQSLLVIILLLITTIICYHYAKHRFCCGKKIETENNEFLKVRFKNRTGYYFDDKIKFEHFDYVNSLIDEKSQQNILIYDILHKDLIGAKPFRTKYNQVDGCIRVYDGSKYLVLFGLEKYDAIYNRIRYLISQKSGITYAFCHYYAKINVDSYDPLPPEKTKTLHNITKLINSVLNKDQDHYYSNILLEKYSYQLTKK